MRNSDRVLWISLAGLAMAAASLSSRTASAAAPPGGGSPYGPTPTPTPTPAPAGTPVTYGTFAGPVRGNPTIWRAQRELAALGYDPLGDDGLFGSRTRTALNDFQRDFGQPVTATLTQPAMDLLETEYARIAPPGALGDLAQSSLPRGCYRSRY